MKKFLSVILVAILFLVQIPGTVLADTPNAISHTVLVLDTSDSERFTYNGALIYTADTAIAHVKTSAKVFVKEILNASRNNYIAIVSFKDTATLETDFTNDYNTLVSKINGLYSSSTDRNIAAGLSTAQSVLNSVSGYQTQKNVVLFTTGMTDCGDYDYNGRYSSSVVGSNWYNTATNVKLYAYANTALSVASRLKNTADIYTLGLFQTMENMPSTGREVVQLFKKTTKDLASSADHYYEVDDPNKLEFAFSEIAGDIIIPLSLKLSYSLNSDTVSSEHSNDQIKQHYERYQYTVKALVENVATAPARNVVCSIELPDEAYPFHEMISATEQQTKSVGDLAPGDNATVTWILEFPWPEDDINVTYSVTAKSDNSLAIEHVDNIFIKSKKIKDNSFIMGVDQWSFSNSTEYFGPSKGKYYMTPTDRTLLFSAITNSERPEIEKFLNKKWGGSCFGMSATAVLIKMGVYDANEIQPPKSTVYEVHKEEDDALESWLNYHQALNYSFTILWHKSTFVSKPVSEQLQIIENLAKEVKNGGSPFVISIASGDSGHAIVGYGHETGNWKFGGFLGLWQREYTNRILIYDPNYPELTDDVYLYYDISTGKYEIPKYNIDTLQGAMDISQLTKMYDYNNTVTNYCNYITTTNLTDYNIKLADSTYKIMPHTKYEDTGLVTFFHDNGPEQETPMVLSIPAENNEYTVDAGGKKNFTIRSSHENYATSVTAEGADEISFSGDGRVEMKGINGKYEMDVVANDGNYNTPWYKTSVTGAKATEMTLLSTSEGVKIDGNNLSDVTLTTSDDFTKKHTSINTSETSILVTSDENSNPAVFCDSDKDGKYETRIETHTVTVQSTVGGKTTFTEIECSEGATVNLEAIADSGYGFSQWSTNDVNLPWTKYFSKRENE